MRKLLFTTLAATMLFATVEASAASRTGTVTKVDAEQSRIWVNGHRHIVHKSAHGIDIEDVSVGDQVTITYDAKSQSHPVRAIRAAR